MGQARRPGARWKRYLAQVVALLALGGAGCAQAGGTTTASVIADAQLTGKVVYVALGLSVGLSTPGLIEALDARTGHVLWKAQTYTTSSAPVLAAGVLYVAADDGTVRAFDAATGQPRWSFTRPVGVSSQLGLDGYVGVSGNTVYVTSDAGAVYALDATTGKQRWLYTLPSAQDHIYTVPVVASGLVYFASGGLDGAVYALDATTGKLRWTLAQSGGFDGQPVLVGDTLYAGATNSPTVHAIDAQTGASRWTYDTVANVLSPIAVGADTIYVGAVDTAVYAIHTSNATLAWKFQTGGAAGNPLIARGAAVTLDGQTLYVGSQGGNVYALDTTTGKSHWSVALNSPIDSPPTLLDGTLFVTTEAGDVVALRASDGARIWQTQTGGFIIAAPLVTTPSGAA